MRAFIEYPDISDDRLEITKSEFVVETKAHRYLNTLERLAESYNMKAVYVPTLEEDRPYWDERMVNEDS